MITILVKNKQYQFVKPYYLMSLEKFKLRKATVKGSILVWNIDGQQITYNKIKNQYNDKTKKASLPSR